ncbi:MAG TPA: DNA N-6-adenine-methyltransferase [Coleofasciculaceae cyanobacterium]|jgi:hypothetical protein
MMKYQILKAKLTELEAEISRVRTVEHYRDAWVGECRPAGSARGQVSKQYQLRSRQAIFNGKKSRYLKASEVAKAKAAVEWGRKLAQLEREVEQVRSQITRAERVASEHGLALPKLNSFEALTQSKSNEWYTKPEYIELARTVLGEIDLDPASNQRAQSWIRAKAYYTQETDGFNRAWQGRVWLNPPYGTKTPKASDWILKAIAEYDVGNVTAAVLLVRGDSKGIKALERRFPCCNPAHRIAFIDASGQEQSNPPPGYRFFYLGAAQGKFRRVFSAIGVVTIPA